MTDNNAPSRSAECVSCEKRLKTPDNLCRRCAKRVKACCTADAATVDGFVGQMLTTQRQERRGFLVRKLARLLTTQQQAAKTPPVSLRRPNKLLKLQVARLKAKVERLEASGFKHKQSLRAARLVKEKARVKT